jgi:glucose/arabinose dehydrogenase
MTLDTDFATNGRAFVAYVGQARNGAPVNRIIRFREVNNVFAEAAVILEDSIDVVPALPPRIRMGRDRKLYVAFPAADWPTADGFRSYAGKILRINDDGTTPRDNPNASPIISAGHAASGSFDWQPSSRFWLSERDRQGRDVLDYFSAAFDGTVAASFDSGLDGSGAAFYPMNVLSAFANDLFIAGLSGRLLRVHFDPRDATRIESTETLIEGQYGRLSDVVVGLDGALYLTTSNRGLPWAAPDDDRILRLRLVAR